MTDHMAPEVCPVCEVPWRDLPEDHNAIYSLRTMTQVCQGTVGPEEYAAIEARRMVP